LPQDLWEQRIVATKCLPRCYMESFRATRDRVHGFCRKLVAAQQGLEEEPFFSWEDCLWAFSMVRSRSVAVPELQPTVDPATRSDEEANPVSQVPLAIIPGLDLLNHHFGSASQLQLVEEQSDSLSEPSNKQHRQWWVLSTNQSVHAGDQLYLSYGDDKDNWKLLLTYGFSIPDNPNSLVFWTWQDLLEAAQRVRPHIFQDRVVAQLMRHPQLGAYIDLSENRATFSLDSKRGELRPSLSNGLAMLSNLVGQLGQPADDSLSSDVLDELIRSRTQELEVCQRELARLQRALGEPNDHAEWKPFVDSIRVAINQEATDLAALYNISGTRDVHGYTLD
jgi:hypothetical protein